MFHYLIIIHLLKKVNGKHKNKNRKKYKFKGRNYAFCRDLWEKDYTKTAFFQRYSAKPQWMSIFCLQSKISGYADGFLCGINWKNVFDCFFSKLAAEENYVQLQLVFLEVRLCGCSQLVYNTALKIIAVYNCKKARFSVLFHLPEPKPPDLTVTLSGFTESLRQIHGKRWRSCEYRLCAVRYYALRKALFRSEEHTSELQSQR